jgi:hypothetical protein
MKAKDLFLPRALIVGHYLALCTKEKYFHAILDYIEAPKEGRPQWISDGAHATTHAVDYDGKTLCLVCMEPAPPTVTNIQVAGLLVHEVVHVWQTYCKDINEANPSKEFEAYSIQMIAQNLMEAYVEQTMGVKV